MRRLLLAAALLCACREKAAPPLEAPPQAPAAPERVVEREPNDFQRSQQLPARAVVSGTLGASLVVLQVDVTEGDLRRDGMLRAGPEGCAALCLLRHGGAAMPRRPPYPRPCARGCVGEFCCALTADYIREPHPGRVASWALNRRVICVHHAT